jgi:hypothetical protein
MHGALEVGVDTQWIRIMPVRDSAFASPGLLDATVTLERLETGRKVALRDSVVRYSGDPTNSIAELWGHNFWTTERIVPGGTYRIVATRSDGASSSATIQIPSEPERLAVLIAAPGGFLNRDYLRVDGAEHVAFADLEPYAPVECGATVEKHAEHILGSTVSSESGAPQVALRRTVNVSIPCPILPVENWIDVRVSPALPPLTGKIVFQWWDLTVTLSGAIWPFGEHLSDATISHSSVGTNVENGVGFVVGVLRKTVPYETCDLVNRPTLVTPCELVYDANSVSLQGRVHDAKCSGLPLKYATVTLSEINGSRVRKVFSDGRGFYRFGALNANRLYRLQITMANYTPVDETLSLSPEENRVKDFDLNRAC